MVDPKDDLRSFLRSNFDPSAISVSFTNADDIDFADYDGDRSYPQVAIVSSDPIVPGGGSMAATGIEASGRGAIQDVVYLVQVDCWGGPDDADVYQSEGSHPDIVANELGQEVHRVCFEADHSDVGPPVPDGYEQINADPPFESDDTNESPTEHREIVTVRMKVTYTP